jgi:DNA (cytosine-5)-methyltransferase 1
VKPRLLDLFCGAGGAAVGYHRAGFDVVGVDIEPQPNYPFKFVQADALDAVESWINGDHWFWEIGEVDAVHASPPCQAHTNMSNRWRGKGSLADERVDLIPATRELLDQSGLPYVIENVGGARKAMIDPITLTGEMFGLGVHRPRLFETSWPLPQPPKRRRQANPVAVYGKHHDGRLLWRRKDGSELRAPKTAQEAGDALGIDWMTWRELCESIPPAYTEYVGFQLRSQLTLHLRGAA